MRKRNIILLSAILLVISLTDQVFVNAQDTDHPHKHQAKENSKLAVVWTSGDADVALKVCFMYTNAAKTAKMV